MDQTLVKSTPSMSFTSGLMIMYGVLRIYLRHPLWFILTTLATLSKFRTDIKKDFPQEWVSSACLTAWMYIRLKNKMEAHEAFEVVRAAVLPAILAIFGTSFRIAESPRTFENLVYFHEMSRKGLFTHSKEEVVQHDHLRYEYRCTSCGYVDLFQHLAIPELTPLFCSADNAFYNSYAPNEVTFTRGGPGNTIAEGAPHCTFIYDNHTTTR
jgi:hypothetical protein